MYGTERYGFTAYGDNPLHPDRNPRVKDPFSTTEIDYSLIYGAGPALKSSTDPGYDWDLKLGPDGDFMYREGREFLGQELAFQAAVRGYRIYGDLITQSAKERHKRDLKNVWEKDSRIASVDSVDVETDERTPDTVSVSAQLTSTEGTVENMRFL